MESIGRRIYHWLWRDPDPIRRWAAGQAVRRFWRHPVFATAAAFCFVFLMGAAVGAIAARASRSSTPLEWILYSQIFFYQAAAGVVLLLAELDSVRRPWQTLLRLGCRRMLQDLTLTPIGAPQVARLLFWGSFRSTGIPLAVLVYFCALAALSAHLWLNGAPIWPFPGAPRWVNTIPALWVVTMAALPVLDLTTNTAIAWRACMLAGGRWGRAPGLLTMALVLGLPAALLAGFQNFSIFQIQTIIRLTAILLCAFATLVILLGLRGRRGALWTVTVLLCLIWLYLLPWPLLGAPAAGSRIIEIYSHFRISPMERTSMDLGIMLIPILTLWAAKVWLGVHCYRRFVANFGRDLEERFSQG